MNVKRLRLNGLSLLSRPLFFFVLLSYTIMKTGGPLRRNYSMNREHKPLWASSMTILVVYLVWIALSKLFVFDLEISLMLKIVHTYLISIALTVPCHLATQLIFQHYKDTFYGECMIEATKSAGLWMLN